MTCFPPDGGSFTFTTPTRSRKQLGAAKCKLIDAVADEAERFWRGERGTANMFDAAASNGQDRETVEALPEPEAA